MAEDDTTVSNKTLDPDTEAEFKRLHRLNDDLLQIDKNKYIAQRSLELSTPPSLTLNSNGIIISVNFGMESLLDYKEEELTGKTLMSIMPVRFHEEYRSGFMRYLQTGQVNPAWEGQESLQFPVLNKDDSETEVNIVYKEFAQNGDRYVVVSMRVDKAGAN